MNMMIYERGWVRDGGGKGLGPISARQSQGEVSERER